MPTGALVFLDLETTGLALTDDVWEFAAVRREPDGRESTYHCFVEHDLTKAEMLPESFRADHDARYDADRALNHAELVGLMKLVFAGRPHVVGAVPNFDTERLARILATAGIEPPWHYHLHDIETMARGYLYGRASIRRPMFGEPGGGVDLDNSDALSRACGIEPPTTGRHTALGDVTWTIELYDAITGPSAHDHGTVQQEASRG